MRGSFIRFHSMHIVIVKKIHTFKCKSTKIQEALTEDEYLDLDYLQLDTIFPIQPKLY